MTDDDAAVEYRPIPPGRSDEFDRILAYAFRPQEGPPGDDGTGPAEDETERADEEGEDDEKLGERRGIFDGEDLRCVCRHYFWDARVRGTGIRLAGLAAVASPPESRRKGLVGHMLRESLVEYRDRDCEFAALWPFRRSFYARYGWATANLVAEVTCPAEDLAFADGDRIGGFRRLDADEWRTADEVYRECAARFGLSIDRPEAWWRNRLFGSFRGDPYVYAYERDGTAAGYLLYRIDDPDDADGRRMDVYDAAYVDGAAFRNLLRFAHYHDSQVETVRLWGPHGDLRDLLDWIPDPDEVEFELLPGPMVRVVDVERALSALPYPDASGELAVEVTDPHAGWNDGTFLLSVEDREGTCRRADDREAGLRVGIGALSQAAVGYRPVERLCRTADVEERTDGAVGTMAALFPTESVYLGDFF